jgi:hypothetical protein
MALRTHPESYQRETSARASHSSSGATNISGGQLNATTEVDGGINNDFS